MARSSPLSGPSSSTPRNATTAARKSLRRTAAYRRKDETLTSPQTAWMTIAARTVRGRFASSPAANSTKASTTTAAATPLIWVWAPARAHPAEETRREVGGAVGDELLVVVLGVDRAVRGEGAHCRQALGDADRGDREATGDDAAPQRDVDDGEGRHRDAGG